MNAKPWFAISALLSALFILVACSSGPAGPRMGTPAYYWQAAGEVYAAGDYVKTIEHLDNLLANENEFTARALPWALVIKSGLAWGYMETANNYEAGAHQNTDPSPFRRQVSENRDSASRLALAFAEDFAKLDQMKGDTVALAFAYPKGSAAPVSQFVKIASGVLPATAEIDTIAQRAQQRGVLLALCRAAGAEDDTAKTEEILKTGSVPRATFLLAMAQTLYDESQLYTRAKLDDPRKLEIFCQRAEDALKQVPASKETKDLDREIQAARKKTKM
jgi:hypothetical protein